MSHNIMQQDRFLSLRRPAWHGLGLVVEYEDHVKKHRRAASGVFGAGADRKQKAHAELMALAVA